MSDAALAPTFAALQQAAEWYALLQDERVADSDREHWRRWFDADSDHRAAWSYVERVGRHFAPLQQGGCEAADAALSSARGVTRRQALQSLVLFGAIGLLGAGALREAGVARQLRAWRADYRTAVGEVRALQLVDGSRLWLNTASAVDVDFSADLRRLLLFDGELLVETAQDARPLVVESREGRMRALGTLFSVRQQSGFTDLAVYDGAVELRNESATRVVQAGEQVRFDAETIGVPQLAQRARQLWSRGLLLAEEIPLRELLAELGRYRRGYLAAAPEVAELRVMGTFPLNDPEQVFALLEQALPVRVRRTLPWWTTVEAR